MGHGVMHSPEEKRHVNSALRLLLLLSRLELNDVQAAEARALCDEVEDWEVVCCGARDRFILPVVYQHLRRLAPPSLCAEQLDLMKQQVMALYRHNLNVITGLSEIHQQLLEPLLIPYVTFKGPSLAVCYYDEPAMRFSRDIDLLVAKDRMAELLALALASGYTPLDPQGLINDPESLAFVAQHQKVITLLSPRGVAVEFHSRIDNIGTVYQSSDLISRAEKARVGGADVSVLPPDELFVYICWHHTKHFWSRLHWLVDLDAMQRHPSFDLERVLACAARHGLTATVEVCLKMAELFGRPDMDPESCDDKRLIELMTLSLNTLQGDLDLEHALGGRNVTPDFAFAWQTDPSHRLRWKLLGWLRIFRPSYADYESWPLSAQWQWLYRPLRPWRESRRRLARARR